MNHIQDFLIANLAILPPLSGLAQPRQPLRIFRVVQVLATLLAGLLVLEPFHTLEISINSLVILGQYIGKFRITFAYFCGTYVLAGSSIGGSDAVAVQSFLFRFGNEKVPTIFALAEIHIILQKVYKYEPSIIFKRFKPITFCKRKTKLGHIKYPCAWLGS